MTRLAFLGALIGVCATAGCGDDPKLIDPTGTWNVTATWGAGTCGITGVDQNIFTVTRGAGDTYLISSSDPAETITGTFICDDKECKLSMQRTGPIDPSDPAQGTGNDAANLKVGADGKISGSGSVSVTGGTSCTQQYSAMGMKS